MLRTGHSPQRDNNSIDGVSYLPSLERQASVGRIRREQLQPGDHVYRTAWCGCVPFHHHGIYVGADAVVHYDGQPGQRTQGKVVRTSLAEFLEGHSLRRRRHHAAGLPPATVVRRAVERVGEDDYHIVWNNCEHFATWCCTGTARSSQVKLVSQAALGVASAAVVFLARRAVERRRVVR